MLSFDYQYLTYALKWFLDIMPGKVSKDQFSHECTGTQPLLHTSNVLLIDNYDSFTWNIYQYLKLEGAEVTVARNDSTTLQDLIDAKPSHLVISPGPGHPDVDAGISNAAIDFFGGKIPVLGVCLGQ